MESASPSIEAHELRRSFKDIEAVAGVSFSVQPGQIFGLLGPNGAGKTTTIRLLTGQIDPSGGHASVAGCDVVTDRQALKPLIGVVFEEQNLYERLSGLNNLRFGCWLYNLPERRIGEVLSIVGLEERAKDPVRTYSNGMKQRLLIARALLHDPPVLFLDEPTRGLDPIAARDVRQAIAQLSQKGKTILLTTHLLEEADQLCSRVAFIVKGRIVANDSPLNLKLQHGRRALKLTVIDPINENNFSQMELGMDNPNDQLTLAELLAHGKVRALHSQEATLEEVFIEVAGIKPA